jgi:hypothetical protein
VIGEGPPPDHDVLRTELARHPFGEHAGGCRPDLERGGPDAAGRRVAQLDGRLVPVLLGTEQQQLTVAGVEVERERGADRRGVHAGPRAEIGVQRLDRVDLAGERVDQRQRVQRRPAAHHGALVDVGGGTHLGAIPGQDRGHRSERCDLAVHDREAVGTADVRGGEQRSELVLEDREGPHQARLVEVGERLGEHDPHLGDPLFEQRRHGGPDRPGGHRVGVDAGAGRTGEQLRADDAEQHQTDHRGDRDGQHATVGAHGVVGAPRTALPVADGSARLIPHTASSSPAGAAGAGAPWPS